MRQLLKNNALVLTIYLLLVITAVFFMFSYNKSAIHLYVNQYVGNRYLNGFFYYLTFLGDGLFAAAILALIMLYNVRTGLYATASFLTAALMATILKRIFFDDVIRPFYFYQWIERRELNYVDGVDLHIFNSFPSGHATQAFGIFMCLVFALRHPVLKMFFFLTALLTSFSRVYLSQHWLADITAGSIVGVIFSIVFYLLIIDRNKFPKLDRSLLSRKTIERGAKK